MTVQAMPWAIQGQSHSAEVARNLVAAVFGAPVAALVEAIGVTTAGGAHGVILPGDLVVTQNGGGAMNVNVAAGRAVIRSTEAASLLAAAYSFLNDGTVLNTIAAADPTNPRIDLVIAQVRDSNYSGANTDARLAVVTGTPAGAPVPPTVPDSCVVLAQVAVAAAAGSILTANITDKRTRAYTVGSLAPYAGSAFRPSGASLYEGLLALDTVLNRLEIGNDTPALSTLIDPAYGAWLSYAGSVVLTQSGGVSKTVNYAKYMRIARTIIGSVDLSVTGPGTAANAVRISLPVTAAASGQMVGSGFVFDTSAALVYGGMAFAFSTTDLAFYRDGSTLSQVGVVGFGAALAAGDRCQASFQYEAATDA